MKNNILDEAISEAENIQLNLCCGDDIREGFLNFDKYPIDDRVKFLDAEILPLPFKNEFADYILINQGLEHLNINPLDFMDEMFRVLKPKGIINVGLPVYSPFVYHVRHNHPIGYFDPICNKRSKLKTNKQVYNTGNFNMVGIKFKRRNFKNMYFHIKSIFRKTFYHTVNFTMQKE